MNKPIYIGICVSLSKWVKSESVRIVLYALGSTCKGFKENKQPSWAIQQLVTLQLQSQG